MVSISHMYCQCYFIQVWQENKYAGIKIKVQQQGNYIKQTNEQTVGRQNWFKPALLDNELFYTMFLSS